LEDKTTEKLLEWIDGRQGAGVFPQLGPMAHWWESRLGTSNDGVRFTVEHYPSCHRRGPWRLIVQVLPGPRYHDWGCFDEQDQPMRWYHQREVAFSEAEAIAKVLLTDRNKSKCLEIAK
jgi:hypothetical protein